MSRTYKKYYMFYFFTYKNISTNIHIVQIIAPNISTNAYLNYISTSI